MFKLLVILFINLYSVLAVTSLLFYYPLIIYLFHDRGHYHIETSPLICKAKQSKSMDWFLYDNGLRLEGVNLMNVCLVLHIPFQFTVQNITHMLIVTVTNTHWISYEQTGLNMSLYLFCAIYLNEVVPE